MEIPALGAGRHAAPAGAPLPPPAGVVERHGMVFLAPEDPLAPLGTMPEADDPAFMAGELPTCEARASAGLLADNFLDMAHFPFVHAGTFGADEAAEVPPYTVAPRRLVASPCPTSTPSPTGRTRAWRPGQRPLVQTRRLTYRCDAPFHLVLRIDFLDAGGTNVIGFFLQPETADSCRIYTTLWRDDLGGDPARMAEAVAFEGPCWARTWGSRRPTTSWCCR